MGEEKLEISGLLLDWKDIKNKANLIKNVGQDSWSQQTGKCVDQLKWKKGCNVKKPNKKNKNHQTSQQNDDDRNSSSNRNPSRSGSRSMENSIKTNSLPLSRIARS